VVLAAGRGERLRPLTDLRPKALCPVDNVALVDLAIERLRLHVDEVAVNAHYLHEQLEAHLADAGVHVSVEQPEALGTAGALGQLRDWIAGRDVLVTNADVWYGDLPPAPLSDHMRLLVTREPGRGDFGDWRYAGTCFMPWYEVRDLVPSPSGLYEVRWREAFRAGRLEFMPYGGVHFDCGTPADYLAANLAASGGRSVIAPDAVVEGEVVDSVVWPQARVEPGERLVRAIRAPGALTVTVDG
jgi:CTP:molybdopterin cytidylyltransferase MocA